MAQDWQKQLPEAQGSRTEKSQSKELYRSPEFGVDGSGSGYEVRILARWDDQCGNRSNDFHLYVQLVIANTNRESEQLGVDQAPKRIRDAIPQELLALKKWNGCHPFGPWYYIENTVYMAGDKDYNGLRKGERKQLRRGGKEPVWRLVGIAPDGTELAHYQLNLTHDGEEKPTSEYRLEWQPWWIIGEGKERQLDAARNAAIWPEATDGQLMDENLTTALKQRLPGLLVEFRAMIESLGFTW